MQRVKILLVENVALVCKTQRDWGYDMQDTKNIKFCAWLRYSQIHPDKVEKLSRGKARYFYKITDDEWAGLKREFDRSEFIKYAQCLDAICDLAY